MEAYGVATHNAFALLGDGEDDDPQALVAHRVLDVPQSAEPKAGKQPPREEPKASDDRAQRGGGGPRGVRRGSRGGAIRGRGSGVRGGYDRPSPEEEDVGADGAMDSGFAAPAGHRGGYSRGGRGGVRGSGRGRGGFRGGRREYDRRDGTGRGHETEKRGGAGKGNWGQATEDPSEWVDEPAKGNWGEEEDGGDNADQNGDTKAEQGATGETEEPETAAEGAEKTPEGEVGEQGAAKEEEKETLTLKEYEEKLKTKSLTNVVQRPEVDMGQFEGLTVFKKIDEGTGLETLEQARPKRTRSKGKKEGKREVIPTAFRVGEPVRRGRGGRGVGRGGFGGRLDREGRTGSGEDFVSRQESWGEGEEGEGSGSGGYRAERTYSGDRGYGGNRSGTGFRGRRGGRRGSYGGEGYAYENKQEPLDMADTRTFPALA